MRVDLYLIRHADALPVGEGGVTEDFDRPLSAEGSAQARALAAAMQRQGIRLELLLTSPLLRTRQTAEGILQQWPAPAPALQVCDHLAPDSKLRKLARILDDLQKSSVALVGHQPHLNEFAAWLIGSKKAQIDIAKAGVAYIVLGDDVGKGAGTLKGLVTLKWFTDRPEADVKA